MESLAFTRLNFAAAPEPHMTAAVPRGRGAPGGPDTRGADPRGGPGVLRRTRVSAGTTIRAVAAEAGVDPALVHHYFGTKDDLFLAALRSRSTRAPWCRRCSPTGVDGAGERLLAAVPRRSGTTRRPGCR